MFDKWLNLPAHLYLRITALTILTVGIALSNVLMSIGAIWIIANWLIQGEYKWYWTNLRSKKSVWWVIIIYFLLAFSLIWSDDIGYGFKDLRIKLPFIVIPLVLATSAPLARKHFYFLLYMFIGIVSYTTLYNFVRFNYFLEFQSDIREMSTFISHVRLSLLVNFGIFITVFLLYRKKLKPWIGAPILMWLLFYLYKSQIINGYIVFVVLVVLSLTFFILKIGRPQLRGVLMLALFFGIALTGYFVVTIVQSIAIPETQKFSDLELYSVNNNPYYHDTTNLQSENGHFVWVYVQQAEMEREWNRRSKIPYDSLDNKGQPMFGTLMRYLTSKGARKDSLAVANLTQEELLEIESGQTGITLNQGLKSRLASFLMEYDIYKNGGDPNGNSLLQRIEHIRAAIGIIQNNWFLGVGNGDVPEAFKKEYLAMDSRLLDQNQHRSHNQFLTIWVSLGILGLILFTLLFVTPFFEIKMDYFALMVLFGLLISCLFQDLIETQAGVTIFALFYSLAIYRGEANPEAH